MAKYTKDLTEYSFSPSFGRKKRKILLYTETQGWLKPYFSATRMTTEFLLPELNTSVSNNMLSDLIPE